MSKKPAKSVKRRPVRPEVYSVPEPIYPERLPLPHYEEVKVEYQTPVIRYYAPNGQRPLAPPPPPRSSVVLLEPDPLDEKMPLIFLIAAERLLKFARDHPQEMQPEVFVRGVLARLCVKDPLWKLVIALDSDTGEVIGHVLAAIEGNPSEIWIYCYQAEVDQAGTDILQKILEIGIDWGKQHRATSILMATHIDPEFWESKYGFESVRTVMKRAI